MKKWIFAVGALSLSFGAQAGDWGKAPIQAKAPIEECLDLGGQISTSYHTDYIYKGYRFGRDTVSTNVNYTFTNLALPVTIGTTYTNIVNGAIIAPLIGDELAIYASVALPSVAGFDIDLGYTQRFYPEGAFGAPFDATGNGEIGLTIGRDVGFAVVSLDIYYNLNAPNSWNNMFTPTNSSDNGAWFYDLGLEREFVICESASLVVSGGVAYSDNYWGDMPNAQAGRSSGWNHYYLRASAPIKLNCRTTLTPYIGYSGAPEGWLTDGAAFGGQTGFLGDPQSDIFHGGVSIIVEF